MTGYSTNRNCHQYRSNSGHIGFGAPCKKVGKVHFKIGVSCCSFKAWLLEKLRYWTCLQNRYDFHMTSTNYQSALLKDKVSKSHSLCPPKPKLYGMTCSETWSNRLIRKNRPMHEERAINQHVLGCQSFKRGPNKIIWIPFRAGPSPHKFTQSSILQSTLHSPYNNDVLKENISSSNKSCPSWNFDKTIHMKVNQCVTRVTGKARCSFTWF